jgi:hypothetical protein
MALWSPWSKLFTDSLRAALDGTPFNQKFPPAPPQKNPDVDGRTHALRVLRKYIEQIVFRIPDPPTQDEPRKKPREFQFEESRILLEWPDNPENLLFPRIEFNPGEGQYLPFGLTPAVFEETRDVIKPGTVLTCANEYVENLQLQVHATRRQHRRAFVAGLEAMLSAPLEEVSGLRFKMPEYYGETVSFQLLGRSNRDDEDSAKNRRRADLTLEMRFNIVRLVNTVELVPSGAQTELTTTDPNAEGD